MWLWDIYEHATDEHRTGTEIGDFFGEILRGDKRRNKFTYYFHNLKFDGQYLIDYLLRNGWEYSDELREGAFNTLISEDGVFYCLKICIKAYKTRKEVIEIRDSFKKIPLSVENIAKSYNTPMLKGDIDYTLYRPPGYSPTPDEIAYVRNDTEIVGRALAVHYGMGLNRMTLASDSFSSFKEKFTRSEFKFLFPILDLKTDNFIRDSYKGGFTWLNPVYKNKDLFNLFVYDVNSMYPWAMYECVLPFGRPVEFSGRGNETPRRPLYVQEVRTRFKLRPGHVPCIQVKRNFRFVDTEYLAEDDGEPVLMVMTNIDLKLAMEQYEFYDTEWLGGLSFRGQSGMFDEFIERFYTMKKESVDGRRQVAKLLLNSCYGKTAKNPIVKSKIPYLDPDKDCVKYRVTEEKEEQPIYTACASFITAHCRNKIVRTIQKIGLEKFVYADTDSVHILGSGEGLIDIDNKRLGAFKEESRPSLAKFLRPKTYMEFIDGKWEKKACGAPDDTKDLMTYENFKLGAVFGKKLRPVQVPGGVVLKETTFQIRS